MATLLFLSFVTLWLAMILGTATFWVLVLAPMEAPKQGEGVEVFGSVDLRRPVEDNEYNPPPNRKAGFKSGRSF